MSQLYARTRICAEDYSPDALATAIKALLWQAEAAYGLPDHLAVEVQKDESQLVYDISLRWGA